MAQGGRTRGSAQTRRHQPLLTTPTAGSRTPGRPYVFTVVWGAINVRGVSERDEATYGPRSLHRGPGRSRRPSRRRRVRHGRVRPAHALADSALRAHRDGDPATSGHQDPRGPTSDPSSRPTTT